MYHCTKSILQSWCEVGGDEFVDGILAHLIENELSDSSNNFQSSGLYSMVVLC